MKVPEGRSVAGKEAVSRTLGGMGPGGLRRPGTGCIKGVLKLLAESTLCNRRQGAVAPSQMSQLCDSANPR